MKSSKDMNEDLVVLNLETGETTPYSDKLHSEMVKIREVELQRKKFLDDKRKKEMQRTTKHFVSVSGPALLEMLDELTIAESGFLYRLLPYVDGKNNLLKYGRHSMFLSDMTKITGRSLRSVKETVKKFMQLGILLEVGRDGRNKTYCLSTSMFSRTKYLGHYFTRLWILPNRDLPLDLKLEDLGVMLRMITFMNTSTNVVANDAYELDYDEIEPATFREVASLVGYGYDSFRRSMRRLEEHGLATAVGTRNGIVVINPYYATRSIDPQNDTVAAGLQAVVALNRKLFTRNNVDLDEEY